MPSVIEIASGVRGKLIEDGVIRPLMPSRERLLRVGDYQAPIGEEAIKILKSKDVHNISIDDVGNQIVIYTNRRITKAEADILPSQLEDCTVRYSYAGIDEVGVKPDVAEVAPCAVFMSTTNGNKYYTCGSSISVGNECSAGTLGALVVDQSGQIFGLSNNHVVGGLNHTPIDMPVVAPGVLDVQPGYIDPFTIGYFSKLMPLTPGDQDNIDINQNIDAALFKLSNQNLVSSLQGGLYDTPTTVVDPIPGMVVEKIGRTTGHRVGRIVGKLFAPERVECSNDNYQYKANIWFDNIYVIHGMSEIFSNGGDSGSLITTKDAHGSRQAVGIVFAGGPDHLAPGGKRTLMLPIRPILEALDVTLVAGHNAT